ncbi:MAG TPA: FIST C-terminal domain-containing protein, partial [Polyangiaceae bacterium]|nr:FIST C-terminal domain-containing protein [Polyangiaceae bacterium]
YRNVRYDAMLAQQKAVAVVALGDPGVPGARAVAALAADPTKGPRRAGYELAMRARESLGASLESAMLFSPGLPTDGPPLDQALADGLRDLEPALGLSGTGMSGGLDLRGFCVPGFALLDGKVERNGALLLAFEGRGPGVTPRRTSVTLGNSLRRVGTPPLVVTQADGVHVISIDGVPAYQRVVDAVRRHERVRNTAVADLEKNLGLTMVELRLAFAVKDPVGEFYWPRIPMRSLPDGSFVDAFEYATGEELHLVEADEVSCLGAAHEASQQLRDAAAMGAARFELVVAFSCSIRGFVLGAGSVEENREVGAIARCDDDNVLGVIANGEIGTLNGGRPRATGWAYSLFGLGDEGRPGGG